VTTETQPYPCSDCGRSFLTGRALASHRQMKHSVAARHRAIVKEVEQQRAAAVPPEAARPYACAECGARFLTQSGLENHGRQAHAGRGRRPISVGLVAFAERHGWKCHWCGEPVRYDVNDRHGLGPSREHLVPASQGGGRRADNLVLAHKRCNQRRGTIDPEAFRRLLAGEAVTAAEMWPERKS